MNAHEELWNKAVAAGRAAGNAARPVPMVVQQHRDMLNDNSAVEKEWVVPEGVCGFAWVKVRPGTTPFARWLVKSGHARAAYTGGVDIWISDYNQSMQRKEAHAQAMAAVFVEAGVKAYADSRMD